MGKFTVIKNGDAEKYLLDSQLYELNCISDDIEAARRKEGKSNNRYAIINLDEPYAGEVINIMRTHGHWGDYEWQNEGDPSC